LVKKKLGNCGAKHEVIHGANGFAALGGMAKTRINAGAISTVFRNLCLRRINQYALSNITGFDAGAFDRLLGQKCRNHICFKNTLLMFLFFPKFYGNNRGTNTEIAATERL
jgi:hypothetical protein